MIRVDSKVGSQTKPTLVEATRWGVAWRAPAFGEASKRVGPVYQKKSSVLRKNSLTAKHTGGQLKASRIGSRTPTRDVTACDSLWLSRWLRFQAKGSAKCICSDLPENRKQITKSVKLRKVCALWSTHQVCYNSLFLLGGRRSKIKHQGLECWLLWCAAEAS